MSWTVGRLPDAHMPPARLHDAGRSPLVLVAEDDPDVRGLVRRALESEGCEVRLAADGAETLALLDDRPPDLLVLDLMMPRVSGLDVLQRLRADGRLTAMPVLVLTARSAHDDVAACTEMGVAGYVTKPFLLRELLERARALLARPSEGGGPDGLPDGPGADDA